MSIFNWCTVGSNHKPLFPGSLEVGEIRLRFVNQESQGNQSKLPTDKLRKRPYRLRLLITIGMPSGIKLYTIGMPSGIKLYAQWVQVSC